MTRMAKYIDRKAVLSILVAMNAPGNAYERIAALPVADVQAVKHGKWMYCSIEDMFHCTRCDAAAVRNSFAYCPICGAKMTTIEPEE